MNRPVLALLLLGLLVPSVATSVPRGASALEAPACEDVLSDQLCDAVPSLSTDPYEACGQLLDQTLCDPLLEVETTSCAQLGLGPARPCEQWRNAPVGFAEPPHLATQDALGQNAWLAGPGLGPDPDILTLALDPRTGTERWRTLWDASPNIGLQTTALVLGPNEERLYLAGHALRGYGSADADWFVLALNARDGAVLWTTLIDGPEEFGDRASHLVVSPDGSAIVVGGSISRGIAGTFGSHADARVAALDAATGAPRWTHDQAVPGIGDEHALGLATGSDAAWTVLQWGGPFGPASLMGLDGAGLTAWEAPAPATVLTGHGVVPGGPDAATAVFLETASDDLLVVRHDAITGEELSRTRAATQAPLAGSARKAFAAGPSLVVVPYPVSTPEFGFRAAVVDVAAVGPVADHALITAPMFSWVRGLVVEASPDGGRLWVHASIERNADDSIRSTVHTVETVSGDRGPPLELEDADGKLLPATLIPRTAAEGSEALLGATVLTPASTREARLISVHAGLLGPGAPAPEV